MKRDYYEVLGIGKQADEKEIKRAYRKLAKRYHPDTNPGDKEAEQKFKEVTEAYNVLSDKEKKKLYDQFGFAAFDEASNARTDAGGGYQEFHFEGGNMDDMFGDIFGDMFHGGFGSWKGYRQQASYKGEDLHADITVGFDEAAFGCEKMIHMQAADGTGGVQSLSVHIPAGIDDGKSVRLRGKGHPGFGGGENGDLLLKVHIAPKAGYERKGMDVYTTAEIPFTTAVFGGEASFPTLYGNVVCKVPAGTQSGQKIRLRGKGIVSMKDPKVHGDQYVTIQIQVPTTLTAEQRQKLHEFEASMKKSGWHAA